MELRLYTVKIPHMDKLEAFEMWKFRRILKISWVDLSNEDVLRRFRTERALLKTVTKRKAYYFGHIMRGDKYRFLQLIAEGKIKAKRSICRKQLSWLRNIRQWTGIRSETCPFNI